MLAHCPARTSRTPGPRDDDAIGRGVISVQRVRRGSSPIFSSRGWHTLRRDRTGRGHAHPGAADPRRVTDRASLWGLWKHCRQPSYLLRVDDRAERRSQVEPGDACGKHSLHVELHPARADRVSDTPNVAAADHESQPYRHEENELTDVRTGGPGWPTTIPVVPAATSRATSRSGIRGGVAATATRPRTTKSAAARAANTRCTFACYRRRWGRGTPGDCTDTVSVAFLDKWSSYSVQNGTVGGWAGHFWFSTSTPVHASPGGAARRARLRSA